MRNTMDVRQKIFVIQNNLTTSPQMASVLEHVQLPANMGGSNVTDKLIITEMFIRAAKDKTFAT
jgi:hypothetical protein